MTHRQHLAEADRLIADCKDHIARQREIIASTYENGHPTVLPVALLRVLEENLRPFEKFNQNAGAAVLALRDRRLISFPVGQRGGRWLPERHPPVFSKRRGWHF